MTKLKTVTVSFQFVMYGTGEKCRILAQEAFRDMSTRDMDFVVDDFDPMNQPELWDLDCFPYGGNCSHSIRHYLQEENIFKVEEVGISLESAMKSMILTTTDAN